MRWVIKRRVEMLAMTFARYLTTYQAQVLKGVQVIVISYKLRILLVLSQFC